MNRNIETGKKPKSALVKENKINMSSQNK